MVLEFGQAIMFLQNMYKDYLDDTPWDLDFEVDLSRCDKALTPQEHYFLANELKRAAVKFDTLCVNANTFKKEMEENLAYHAGIAKAFDYRMSFADTALAFDDLAAVAKSFHQRVNFKLTHVLWLAALQTIAKTDGTLLKQIAEKAGLQVPEAEELTFEKEAGRAFAAAYDKMLGCEEGKEKLPVRESVEKEIGLYETNLAALVNGFKSLQGGVRMDEKIARLNEMIRESKRIVFFGGAGVSTESGIPDFRSTDGLYNQTYQYPPEMIVSHTFYEDCPEEFFDFYKNRMLFLDAKPNAAHLKLAELERAGKLTAVITQNIDGLHQAAGSKTVMELHGSVLRNYCEDCNKFFDVNYVKNSKGVPVCDKCGGRVKPDVVLYEENLNMDIMEASVNYISQADMLIIGGTSLVVYPAAGLIRYYRGNKLVLVNKSETSADRGANLVIHDSIGKVFSQIVL